MGGDRSPDKLRLVDLRFRWLSDNRRRISETKSNFKDFEFQKLLHYLSLDDIL